MTNQRPQLVYAPQQSEGPSQPSPGLSPLLIILACVLVPAVLGYSILVTDETQAVAGVIALLGLMVVIARLFWGLIFFVALLYIRPEDTFPALAAMRLTLTVSLVAMAGLWLQLCLNRERFVRTPLNLFICAFGIWAITTSLP